MDKEGIVTLLTQCVKLAIHDVRRRSSTPSQKDRATEFLDSMVPSWRGQVDLDKPYRAPKRPAQDRNETD
jgi:hypothetical protein